jgi:hypothetical protein
MHCFSEVLTLETFLYAYDEFYHQGLHRVHTRIKASSLIHRLITLLK